MHLFSLQHGCINVISVLESYIISSHKYNNVCCVLLQVLNPRGNNVSYRWS